MSGSVLSAGVEISGTGFADGRQFRVQVTSVDAIARGGSSQIFLGYLVQAQVHRNETVALKLFVDTTAEYQRQLITRELRAVRRIRHRHILPYIGSAQLADQTVLVSPYMKNGNLLQYLSRVVADRDGLLIQVATAVEYLHTVHKMVHGDLKCENVLIADDGTALLADFGLSTLIERTETSTRTDTLLRQLVTIQFAAPELLLENETSSLKRPARRTDKTDVYAFGMMVIQAVTGQSPWSGCNSIKIVLNLYQRTTHPRPKALSDIWWGVCVQCLAHSPLERPKMETIVAHLSRGKREAPARTPPRAWHSSISAAVSHFRQQATRPAKRYAPSPKDGFFFPIYCNTNALVQPPVIWDSDSAYLEPALAVSPRLETMPLPGGQSRGSARARDVHTI